MLRMNVVNDVDHQAVQHMLTEGCGDWAGFSDAIARETDALLGGPASVPLIHESGLSKKGFASAGVTEQWNGRLGKVETARSGCSRCCVGARWPV